MQLAPGNSSQPPSIFKVVADFFLGIWNGPRDFLQAVRDQKKVYRCGTLSYTTRGLIALFAWMLWGDFCFTLMESVVPSIMPLKLRSLESPNVIIGFIMTTLPGVFNITVTPVLSFKSDRYRSKYGRRLPFILYTLPFLTLTLVLIAYDDALGHWVKTTFLAGNAFSEAKVIIILLAIFAAMFDFFNMFVNTVYWYLFNDVVPQEWMGRFMAWFKLVGNLAGGIYSFFIFQFAETHMRTIYLGAAIVYFVGFGIVCLRMKEGEYPPPEAAGPRQSLLEKFRSYARECYSSQFYLDTYLSQALYAMAACVGVFNIFALKSMGLDLKLIGRLGFIAVFTGPLCLIYAGSLVDKWNSVRVAAYWSAFGAFSVLGNWVWLFVDTPNPNVFFWTNAIAGGVFSALLGNINSILELPRLMALYPKDRFGQYCGAIALVRAPAAMVGGVLAGLFMDLCRRFFPTGNYAYRFHFFWSAPLIVLAFYYHYRVYRAWKRLGGEKSYVAPTASFKLADLKPHPDDDGKVLKGPLVVIGIAWVGGLLSALTWWGYYSFFEPQPRYAIVFLLSAILSLVLFGFFLRFLKFMERP